MRIKERILPIRKHRNVLIHTGKDPDLSPMCSSEQSARTVEQICVSVVLQTRRCDFSLNFIFGCVMLAMKHKDILY